MRFTPRFSYRLMLACSLSLLAALCLFTIPLPARAQTPSTINIPVALAPVQRDTPVELTALTLDADIGESNGRTYIVGTSTFKLHNTDAYNDAQIALGFPTWAGDTFTFDPAKLSAFAVTVDGKKITLAPGRADIRVGAAVRAADWYTFTLTIAADEKKTVRLDFQQDLGDGVLPRFVYGTMTANGWKGSIGSARLTIGFPNNTTMEQIATFDPPNPSFDGARLTWDFTTREAASNISLAFLRPSTWSDLQARRRAAAQNPNDANAHAALGSILRQLSQADSNHRENYLAQAISELEMATVLDPNQRSARQTLAALYESRAGPAAGPRQVAYVALAIAQWQALAAGDQSARKQLAEDYFYLALDAQARGAWSEAQSYFEKATELMPNGAGPLFTLERASMQRRALNVAWAQYLIERGDLASAIDKARAGLGDGFLKSFVSPPFYIARAHVTMAPRTRSTVLTLSPWSSSSSELLKSLNDLTNAWRALGAEVSVVPEKSDLIVTIDIPFANETELSDRLDSLSRPVPDRAEWALVRQLFLPSELRWSGQALVFNLTRYREHVDLSSACSSVQRQLETVVQVLKPLENASLSDPEAQLKRALVKNAQAGWQRALAQGRVSYRSGANETSVDPCTTRTIESSSNPLRIEWLLLIASVLGLLGGLILFVVWTRRVAARETRAQEGARRGGRRVP